KPPVMAMILPGTRVRAVTGAAWRGFASVRLRLLSWRAVLARDFVDVFIVSARACGPATAPVVVAAPRAAAPRHRHGTRRADKRRRRASRHGAAPVRAWTPAA